MKLYLLNYQVESCQPKVLVFLSNIFKFNKRTTVKQFFSWLNDISLGNIFFIWLFLFPMSSDFGNWWLSENIGFLVNVILTKINSRPVTEMWALLISYQCPSLTHFMSLVCLYENIKNRVGFLMFSGGREREQWHDVGWLSQNNLMQSSKLV